MLQTILAYSSGPLALLLVTLFLRVWPKAKAIETGSILGSKVGDLLTAWGNKKVGKKTWSAIEEGPITTGFCFIVSFINACEFKMTSDNSPVSNPGQPEADKSDSDPGQPEADKSDSDPGQPEADNCISIDISSAQTRF